MKAEIIFLQISGREAISSLGSVEFWHGNNVYDSVFVGKFTDSKRNKTRGNQSL